MPPRFVYWTVLIDKKPTAFRASERDELIPVFKQLQRTNRDVALKWSAHGRLWDSPEAERAARAARQPTHRRSTVRGKRKGPGRP